MEYIFTHLLQILAAGLLIGLLGFCSVYFSERSSRIRSGEDQRRKLIVTKPVSKDGCGFQCNTCLRAAGCPSAHTADPGKFPPSN